MKNFKTLLLSIFAASLFLACNNDDNLLEVETNQTITDEIAEDALEEEAQSKGLLQSFKALKEATILLASIRKDGGIPYNFFNPALRFTDAQNVFVPSVLGIDFRIDRAVSYTHLTLPTTSRV